MPHFLPHKRDIKGLLVSEAMNKEGPAFWGIAIQLPPMLCDMLRQQVVK